MTAKQYNELSTNARADYLWDQGIFLLQRQVKGNYIIKMYSLEKFFVEVCYNATDNCIDDISALEKDDDWYGYLNFINLKLLLNHK